MDEMLKAGLLPDEKILWRGKAEPFTTLDKTHKKRFIICAGIGLLITTLVAVAYFAAIARGGLRAKPYVLLIVLLLCGIPAFNMLGDASKLKKMEYVVTNIGSFLKDICTCLLGSAVIAAEYSYFSGMRALPVCFPSPDA